MFPFQRTRSLYCTKHSLLHSFFSSATVWKVQGNLLCNHNYAMRFSYTCCHYWILLLTEKIITLLISFNLRIISVILRYISMATIWNICMRTSFHSLSHTHAVRIYHYYECMVDLTNWNYEIEEAVHAHRIYISHPQGESLHGFKLQVSCRPPFKLLTVVTHYKMMIDLINIRAFTYATEH